MASYGIDQRLRNLASALLRRRKHETGNQYRGGLLHSLATLFLPGDPVQRGRCVFYLLGAANCMAGVLALHYSVDQDLIDPVQLRWLTLSAVAVSTTFYVVFRCGLNQFMADPSLADYQSAIAVVHLAWGYQIGGPARPIALVILVMVLMLCACTCRVATLMRTSLLAAMLFGGAMWHIARHANEPSYTPQLQAALFALLTLVFISAHFLMKRLKNIQDHASRHRQELLAIIRRLQDLATRDELTRLFNRRHMQSLLDAEAKRSQRLKRCFSVCLIDIDHFKAINDKHGHGVGDAVLSAVAQAIAKGLRDTDCVARWGGEEFLVMFTDTEAATAETVVLRILHALQSSTVCAHAPALRVSFSAGLTSHHADEGLPQTIERADRALYMAKAAGRAKAIRLEPALWSETIKHHAFHRHADVADST